MQPRYTRKTDQLNVFKPTNKQKFKSMLKITLEQWQVFKAIVDEGSFAAAADALNKSQSAISYSMQQMAAQLATPVLSQQGRKAVLTPAGEVLYRHANYLLKQAQDMEALANDMAQGVESTITIAVDAIAPQLELLEGLRLFSEQCPRTRVKILETTLSGTDEALLTGKAQVAITPYVPPGFLGDHLTTVRMIPVAAATHILGKSRDERHPYSDNDLKLQRQIVIRDSGTKREQNAGWLGAEQRWTFSHFASSISAIKAGLGFAFVPQHAVAKELASGELVPLNLESGGERLLALYLVQAAPNFAGPAVVAAVNALKKSFKKTTNTV